MLRLLPASSYKHKLIAAAQGKGCRQMQVFITKQVSKQVKSRVPDPKSKKGREGGGKKRTLSLHAYKLLPCTLTLSLSLFK